MGDTQFYTIGEFAEKLNVSVNTLRNWDRSGFLKARRVGNRRLYSADELAEYESKKHLKRGRLVDVSGKQVASDE